MKLKIKRVEIYEMKNRIWVYEKIQWRASRKAHVSNENLAKLIAVI